MTAIKFCGLTRPVDIEAANEIRPEYIGFVFAPHSKRCLSPKLAKALKEKLRPEIKAVGIFVREEPAKVAALLNSGLIELAQLHGGEDEDYMERLRSLSGQPIIKAFHIGSADDAAAAERSTADYILLDSGPGGGGMLFDWSLIQNIARPYFLAGGLNAHNVTGAIKTLRPYAVDLSSGLESNGLKDKAKMEAFAAAVRKGTGR